MNKQYGKMLVVDDIVTNRMILSELFADRYDVLEAENGQEALDLLDKHGEEISIVLLDIVMPVVDGFEVLERMNKMELMGVIPVVLISSSNDQEDMLRGYELGVSDIISKPFDPSIVSRRVDNIAALYNHQSHMREMLEEQRVELELQAEKVKVANLFIIDALSTTLEFRDLESGDHVRNIRRLTKLLLEGTKGVIHDFSEEEITLISDASVMHDIGKIAIPDSILLKPGRLTSEEFETMKTHSVKGCDIIAKMNYDKDMYDFDYAYDICRHHHERWDGKGYPDGLKGDEISIWAQATGLADVYEALTADRVYKPAFSHEQAVAMIVNGECGQFNPKMIDCFVKIQDRLRCD